MHLRDYYLPLLTIAAAVVICVPRLVAPSSVALTEVGWAAALSHDWGTLGETAMLRLEPPGFLLAMAAWRDAAVPLGISDPIFLRLPGVAAAILLALVMARQFEEESTLVRAALAGGVLLFPAVGEALFRLGPECLSALAIMGMFAAFRAQRAVAFATIAAAGAWWSHATWPATAVMLALGAVRMDGTALRLKWIATAGLLPFAVIGVQVAAMAAHWEVIGGFRPVDASPPSGWSLGSAAIIGLLAGGDWLLYPETPAWPFVSAACGAALVALIFLIRSARDGDDECGRMPDAARDALVVAGAHLAICWLVSRLGLLWTWRAHVDLLPVAPLAAFGLVAAAAPHLRSSAFRMLEPLLLILAGVAVAVPSCLMMVSTSSPWAERLPTGPLLPIPATTRPWLERAAPDREFVDLERAPDQVGVTLLYAGWLAPPIAAADAVLLALLREKHMNSEYEPLPLRLPLQARVLGRVEEAAWNERLASGFAPDDSTIPENAVAKALPQHQRLIDGWSELEGTADGRVQRWGGQRTVPLRFNRDLPAGRYQLVIEGYRPPYPSESEQVRIRLGRDVRERVTLSAGSFRIDIPIRLKRDTPGVVELRHPVWSPALSIDGSVDDRQVTFLFLRAWIAPPAP